MAYVYYLVRNCNLSCNVIIFVCQCQEIWAGQGTQVGTEEGDGKCIDVLTDNLRDLESSYTDSTALSSLIYLFPNWMAGLCPIQFLVVVICVVG